MGSQWIEWLPIASDERADQLQPEVLPQPSQT
jgi:hypothetical protein